MKKTTFLILLFLCINTLNAQVYENTTVYPVPDGTTGCGSSSTPGQADSVVNVPLTGAIVNPSQVTIGVQLLASWYGESVVVLVPPGGGEGCALIRRIGATTATACGSSGDFSPDNLMSFNSTFTNAVPALTGTNIVPAGDYAPTGGSDTFPMNLCDLETLLNGLSVEGDWTLRVLDHGGGDNNEIHLFRITFGENALNADTHNFSAQKLTVVANPFDNVLELHNSASNLSFTVHAIDGKKIYEQVGLTSQNEIITINTQSWNSGMYFIVPIVDGQAKTPIKVIRK